MRKSYWISSLAIIAVVIIAIALWITFRTPTRSPQTTTYLRSVYPLANPKKLTNHFFRSLDFYWYSKDATAPLFKNVTNKVTPGSSPEFVCLSWMLPCQPGKNTAVVRNNYKKRNPKNNRIAGIPDNNYAEVYHNDWYHEPGIYYYALKGTGIFLNVGHTLIARNKVDALQKLGLSASEILEIGGVYIVNDISINTFRTFKILADKAKKPFPKYLPKLIKDVAEGNGYQLDRISNTSSYDYPLYIIAKEKGYDTVQLTTQPNDNGGWGFELLDVRPNLKESLTEKWQLNKKRLSIRNPFNLKQSAPCEYHIPYKILRCATTTIKINNKKPKANTKK